MKVYWATGLILTLITSFLPSQQEPGPQIETRTENGITTVRLTQFKVSGEKDHYYSLHLTLSFKQEQEKREAPEFVDLELQTVVKRRLLNPDLYIVFLIDGEEVFLSSSRSAVKNPIRGRRWIGERIVMRMPRETFQRFATAKGTAIRMGSTVFEIDEAPKATMSELLKRMETPKLVAGEVFHHLSKFLHIGFGAIQTTSTVQVGGPNRRLRKGF